MCVLCVCVCVCVCDTQLVQGKIKQEVPPMLAAVRTNAIKYNNLRYLSTVYIHTRSLLHVYIYPLGLFCMCVRYLLHVCQVPFTCILGLFHLYIRSFFRMCILGNIMCIKTITCTPMESIAPASLVIFYTNESRFL